MKPGTVFVIDDDSSVRKALQRLIRAAGYDVEVLEDAAAYLHRASPSPPACLVLDIRMPGIGGFELQQRIAGTAHAVPIIFITGHGDMELRQQAMSEGLVDLLEKPLEERSLLNAVERALALSRKSAAAEPSGGN